MTTVTASSPVAQKAHDLERNLIGLHRQARGVWASEAMILYVFKSEKTYKERGYTTFKEWLDSLSDEVSISESYANTLIGAYKLLAIEHEIELDQLAEYEITKIRTVLPAVRRGDVTVETAFKHCDALSRSSLREEYSRAVPDGPLNAEQEPEWCTCACGDRHRSKTNA